MVKQTIVQSYHGLHRGKKKMEHSTDVHNKLNESPEKYKVQKTCPQRAIMIPFIEHS